jgi:hypothetical protein
MRSPAHCDKCCGCCWAFHEMSGPLKPPRAASDLPEILTNLVRECDTIQIPLTKGFVIPGLSKPGGE